MKTSMSSTGIMILVSFVILLVVLWLFNHHKSKKRLKKFKALGHQYQLHLTEADVWNQFGIGIDKSKNSILFKQNEEPNSQFTVLEIEKIRRAEVNKVTRTQDQMTVIDSIELKIFTKEANNAVQVLEFFNVKNQLQLNDEYHLAEKWASIINEKVK
jgi:hypothetical protein